MLASRLATRNAARFTAQLRAPAQRRLASTSAENEFIKERQHIKEHAQGTTGESFAATAGSIGSLEGPVLTDSSFVEEDFYLVRCFESVARSNCCD